MFIVTQSLLFEHMQRQKCTVTTVLLTLSTREGSSAWKLNVLLKLEITHHGEHKEAL